MGRSPYQSEKRRKELARLKKQEEKRQRRFNKKNEVEGEAVEGQAEGAPGAEVTPAEETTSTEGPAQDPTQNDAQP